MALIEIPVQPSLDEDLLFILNMMENLGMSEFSCIEKMHREYHSDTYIIRFYNPENNPKNIRRKRVKQWRTP
jgi:hypothetical protein